jgi:hypothetical protein
VRGDGAYVAGVAAKKTLDDEKENVSLESMGVLYEGLGIVIGPNSLLVLYVVVAITGKCY